MTAWRENMRQSLLDYRDLRPRLLTSPRYRHLLLLLYWPLYGLLFSLVEAWDHRDWTAVEWPAVDGLIPFCEYFVIPYMFWFLFLAGMVAFTLLFDKVAFRRMMSFIIITYTVTIVIYLLWPNRQLLRPETFVRDNVFTRFMDGFYDYDTNTNVCPSIHVIGSVAVLLASWHTPYFKGRAWQSFFWVWTVLISVSTVFLKQHSIIDLLAALVLCVLSYPLAFEWDRVKLLLRRKSKKEAGQEKQAELAAHSTE